MTDASSSPAFPAASFADAAVPGVETRPLLVAARGGRPARTPVWFMRQAGRSLPEYRALRAGGSMLDACTDPDMVTEITLQPVRRHGVDAAIFFSDIVVPLLAVGIDVEIQPGVGPVIADPVRTMADLDRLRPLDPSDVGYVTQAVQSLVGELGEVPLIGFAGAPFTLASYLVEGGPSKNHERTKALMHGDPALWHGLLERLSIITGEFLAVQARAGASALQLFDSWAGNLSLREYTELVLPHSAAVLARIAEFEVPRIHFGVGTGELLAAMHGAGADVLGVDFRVDLADAARRVPGVPLQGNLDPALLFAPWGAVEAGVRRVLESGRSAPGHIFNLGHGVLPGTDPDVLTRVVELVHELSSEG